MTKMSPITLLSAKNKAKELDVLEPFLTNDETQEGILYNKKFSKTKIDLLIQEFLKDIQSTVEQENEFFKEDSNVTKYIMTLIIKHFSHFKEEIGVNFEDKIAANVVLYDLGLFDLFFDEIFNKDEVDKVMKQVEDSIIKVTGYVKQELDALNKLEEKKSKK